VHRDVYSNSDISNNGFGLAGKCQICPVGYIIKDTGKDSIAVVPNIHGTFFIGLSKATWWEMMCPLHVPYNL
jgi:hypothetical protein